MFHRREEDYPKESFTKRMGSIENMGQRGGDYLNICSKEGEGCLDSGRGIRKDVFLKRIPRTY